MFSCGVGGEVKSFVLKYVKYFVIHFFYYTGLLFIVRKIRSLLSTRNNLIILMYHRVVNVNDKTKYFQNIFLSQPIFLDKQMAFLSQHYNVISMAKVYSIINQGEKIWPKSVLKTVDNGPESRSQALQK